MGLILASLQQSGMVTLIMKCSVIGTVALIMGCSVIGTIGILKFIKWLVVNSKEE